MIRVLIADDEPGMRLIEKKMIGRVDGFELCGEAKDGEELLRMVDEFRPQIVFLDVEMPGKTGVECARIIQDTNPGILMIFATAHDQYMGNAFSVYAFDYLVKPFKVERVMKTLERARDILSGKRGEALPAPRREKKKSGGRLMLRHKDGLAFVAMDDILLVQREERATVIYTDGGGRYVTSDSLQETEDRLDPDVFFRCHRSYIINLNRIRDITPYGRWTYIVKLDGTEQDALITHEKYEELQSMFD